MKHYNLSFSLLLTLILFALHGRGQSAAPSGGQARTITGFNDGWEFTKDEFDPGANTASAKWEAVQLPHSWNTSDVMDDEPGYYRGVGWYRKKLVVDPSFRGKQLYLRFEGANQLAEVYVNGKKAGSHTGGYTAFQFPVSSLLNFDSADGNHVLVKVDNSHNPQVPPLSADFTFFGGIYRDAWLISVSPVHFSFSNYGSNGVFISTPEVNEKKAVVHVRGNIANQQQSVRQVKVLTSVLDRDGNKVKEVQTSVQLKPRTETSFVQEINTFNKPRLWSPDDPYLYTVKTIITDASSGQVLDEVVNPLGFRWFRFDAEQGFFLNGKPCKLVGASRHQDRPGLGNAVPDELARQDIEWLKKMGGNFLRVAHYPQDPSVLEACDRLGILASVEIPVVNEITESDTFYNNCVNMQVEMIRQNFNHPSVVMWCYMNEVLLRMKFNNDKERQKTYIANVTKLAVRLDSVTRAEDPLRYTMIAHHGDFDKYRNAGLNDVPMVIGWNLYSGWYGGDMENFPAFLDKHRRQMPHKPMVVSEYGADADPRIRSFDPVRFDKSVEYANRFHQYYLQEMMKRPFVAGVMIWNLADFNSETREETMPHINNKGLLTWDRTPKDPFYFYQAMFSNSPFVKIISGGWKIRTGIADSASGVCRQLMQVASNLDSVELIVNGKSQGWKKPSYGLCEWTIPFVNDLNTIEAKGKRQGQSYTDQCAINFSMQPYLLNDTSGAFREMNILLGANRYFIDDKTGQIWQPDQVYRSGSWGHTGGKAFKLAGNTRLPYGTDKDIFGTDNDPVYQTQQTGLSGYRLDVPPGGYELTLHFAELQGNSGKDIPYNLSPPGPRRIFPERRFHVYINDQLMLENFDIAGQYGTARAVSKKFVLSIQPGASIDIKFVPVAGEPVLNAIQVRRRY
ncbi:MAG TPA: glycoside hydrolase family 2 TIM barrel-domain containing protein [Chitinophagaceae bacterium]|nr:glycoside hydrolase family 2 TIM barrel-domain containing protein [Chitinophagaceae bacterium]